MEAEGVAVKLLLQEGLEDTVAWVPQMILIVGPCLAMPRRESMSARASNSLVAMDKLQAELAVPAVPMDSNQVPTEVEHQTIQRTKTVSSRLRSRRKRSVSFVVPYAT